jgi:hypothetical protein
MNLEYSWNLWKLLDILLSSQNNVENESSTTKQTWLDEMKIWYVCLF